MFCFLCDLGIVLFSMKFVILLISILVCNNIVMIWLILGLFEMLKNE